MTDRRSVPEAERWTRGRVAKELGVSVSTVRRLERAGRLTPELGEGQVRLHLPEQVREIAAELAMEPGGAATAQHHRAWGPNLTSTDDVEGRASVDGGTAHPSVAARVFAEFERGAAPTDVVVLLEVAPGHVEDLYLRWCRMRELPLALDHAEVAAELQARVRALEEALALADRGTHAWMAAMGEAMQELFARTDNVQRMLQLLR